MNMDWLSVAGLLVGIGGVAWAVMTEWNAAKERGRMYSFLNGLRVSVFADEVPRGAMNNAIETEMARLDPKGFAQFEAKKAEVSARFAGRAGGM